MNKYEVNDFFQFMAGNESAKKELIKTLEKHDLLALEKNRQENVTLDAIIKVAKKYNFDIDKSDLKKYLNEGTSELDDDQLLNVAGGGLFPWGLLLLQIFSSGGPAVGSLSPNETANTLPDTSIVQTYNETQDENALDFTDDSETAADESTGILEGQENVTDANEPDCDTNSQGSQTAEPEITKDTTEAEIEFSLKLLEKLPQKGDAGFDDFLKITGVETLTDSKDVKIKHSNGTSETLNINEKEVYAQIENTVREILQKVESRTPDENMSQEDIDLKINGKEISKHYRLSKQMRIAKAIYRWVAKNITYDFESIEGDPFAKPQNALFVFNQKSGICAGYANLTNLMMRMAGIPSARIITIYDKTVPATHAYNTVYFEDTTTNQKGWTLIDSTWAAPKSDKNLKEIKDLSNIKIYFPGFYDANKNFAAANKSVISKRAHKIGFVNNTGTGERFEAKTYELEVDGVTYELCGKEGNAYIRMTGDADNPIENVQIPSDLAELGLKFAVSLGIKSITLNGNETIEVTLPQLENIDTTNSNKHIAEDGILFEKNADGSKGTAVDFFKRGTEIEGFTCYPKKDYESNKLISIEIFNFNGENFANIKKLPEQLTQFNVPIKIGYGIKAVALHGNEKIDATGASWLKTIDITNSNVYYEANGNLYEKDSNQQVFLPEGVAIVNNN